VCIVWSKNGVLCEARMRNTSILPITRPNVNHLTARDAEHECLYIYCLTRPGCGQRERGAHVVVLALRELLPADCRGFLKGIWHPGAQRA
jgi:hypothetical protein